MVEPSAMDSLSSGSLSDSERQNFIDNFQQQIMVANIQDLLQKLVEKCFKKCVSKPGTTLESSQQKCLAMCMDRYLDSHNLVTKTYINRLQRESNV